MRLQISMPKAGTRVFGMMTISQLEPLPLRIQPSFPIDLFPDLDQICMSLKDLKSDGYYRAHLPYHAEVVDLIKDFEVVTLILRDPRDIIVSMAYYARNLSTSAFNFQISNKQKLSDLPLSARFDYLIEYMVPVFSLFEPWRHVPGIEIFFYEDYAIRPEMVFERLSALGFGSAPEIMERSTCKDWGFRVGTIMNWKIEFNAGQKERAQKNFGDIIENWRSES